MSFRSRSTTSASSASAQAQPASAPAGKRTLTERLAVQRKRTERATVPATSAAAPSASTPPPAWDPRSLPGSYMPELDVATVQRKEDASTPLPDADTHEVAAEGVSGASSKLSHADTIARAFGPEHAATVQSISAHTDGAASRAAGAIGATAYATDNHVALDARAATDLHTQAHEAAHVVQQQRGVSLYGGLGQAGDAYEQHADLVADAVVRGESAAGLLHAGAHQPSGSVQRKAAAQPDAAEQITTAPRQDPDQISDPSMLVEFMSIAADEIAANQRNAAKTAKDLIALPEPKKRISLAERILTGAISLAVDIATDGLTTVLFAGVKKVAFHGEGAAEGAEDAAHAAEGLGTEIAKDGAKAATKVAPEKAGDAAKEHAKDAIQGAEGETGSRELMQALIQYIAGVDTGITAQHAAMKEFIVVHRGELLQRPLPDLRAIVKGLRRIASEQEESYKRGVMMGWMDLRARAATNGRPAGGGAATTMMPDANTTEPNRHMAVWSDKLPGFVNIRFDVPAAFSSAADLRLSGVSINAETEIVEAIRESKISLKDLPAPRRVFLAAPDGQSGITPFTDVPWFVVTATGSIEVAAGVTHHVLTVLGSGRPGRADTYDNPYDADPRAEGGAAAGANHGIANAMDLAAAIRGANLVYNELAHYTAANAAHEESS
jgi:hypothetical protein